MDDEIPVALTAKELSDLLAILGAVTVGPGTNGVSAVDSMRGIVALHDKLAQALPKKDE